MNFQRSFPEKIIIISASQISNWVEGGSFYLISIQNLRNPYKILGVML